MSEYRLSKVNNNDLEPVKDKREVAKVSKNTKLVPKTKNYLVQITDNTKVVCIKAGKGLVKVADKILTIIRNKLTEVDWKKLILALLKDLLITTQETQTTTYYTYKTRTTSRPEQRTAEYTTGYVEGNNIQEQIQTSRTETKSIQGKNQKSLEGKKDIRKIQKKDVKSIPKSKQQPLMIEKQKRREDYNNRKD